MACRLFVSFFFMWMRLEHLGLIHAYLETLVVQQARELCSPVFTFATKSLKLR